jgi:hypothetical protein
MEENGVVDLLFQLMKSHVEILRQGVEILIFLAQHSDLTTAHLDALWDGSLVRESHTPQKTHNSKKTTTHTFDHPFPFSCYLLDMSIFRSHVISFVFL